MLCVDQFLFPMALRFSCCLFGHVVLDALPLCACQGSGFCQATVLVQPSNVNRPGWTLRGTVVQGSQDTSEEKVLNSRIGAVARGYVLRTLFYHDVWICVCLVLYHYPTICFLGGNLAEAYQFPCV